MMMTMILSFLNAAMFLYIVMALVKRCTLFFCTFLGAVGLFSVTTVLDIVWREFVAIQRLFRGMRAYMQVRSSFRGPLTRTNAAIRMQKRFRGFFVRNRRNRAATLIQKMYPGKQARAYYRAMLLVSKMDGVPTTSMASWQNFVWLLSVAFMATRSSILTVPKLISNILRVVSKILQDVVTTFTMVWALFPTFSRSNILTHFSTKTKSANVTRRHAGGRTGKHNALGKTDKQARLEKNYTCFAATDGPTPYPNTEACHRGPSKKELMEIEARFQAGTALAPHFVGGANNTVTTTPNVSSLPVGHFLEGLDFLHDDIIDSSNNDLSVDDIDWFHTLD